MRCDKVNSNPLAHGSTYTIKDITIFLQHIFKHDSLVLLIVTLGHSVLFPTLRHPPSKTDLPRPNSLRLLADRNIGRTRLGVVYKDNDLCKWCWFRSAVVDMNSCKRHLPAGWTDFHCIVIHLKLIENKATIPYITYISDQVGGFPSIAIIDGSIPKTGLTAWPLHTSPEIW